MTAVEAAERALVESEMGPEDLNEMMGDPFGRIRAADLKAFGEGLRATAALIDALDVGGQVVCFWNELYDRRQAVAPESAIFVTERAFITVSGKTIETSCPLLDVQRTRDVRVTRVLAKALTQNGDVAPRGELSITLSVLPPPTEDGATGIIVLTAKDARVAALRSIVGNISRAV